MTFSDSLLPVVDNDVGAAETTAVSVKRACAMWISKRTDYATRAVLALSIAGEETTLKLEELAGRIAVPRSVLEQLMPVMRSAGIARSQRGPKGGYRLNTRPEENHTRARRATL
jgi:hypothetical protein